MTGGETFQEDSASVEVAIFNDGLAHLSRRAALQWCAERGVHTFELGVGGWRQADHVDLDRVLRERSARDELLSDLAEFGISVGCVNAAGNPLHPVASVASCHAAALDGAVALARRLGVEQVVTMSGCPAGPDGGSLPIFAPWALNPDCEDLWAWQWEERVRPFWTEFARSTLTNDADVRVCIELHAGAAIYNPSSFRRLSVVTGGRVKLNFDPSHFWWMGIDPLAVLELLGDQVGWVHAKDTLVRNERVREDGVLDFRRGDDGEQTAWSFTSVGDGHGDAYWHELLAALVQAGYEGPVSIEYEEPPPRNPASIEAGVERSLRALTRILAPSTHEAA
jgi:sugar phosphate isomerase/epimerase